jgi:imidazolonepropionase-like amidohydrolase
MRFDRTATPTRFAARRNAPARGLARTILATALAAGAIFPRAAQAQDLTLKPAPAQSQPIIIQNATIHTLEETPRVLTNATIWFEGGAIRGIEPDADFKQREKAMRWAQPPRYLDAQGMHVYPGFISPHSQLGLTEIQAVRAGSDFDETGDVTPEVRPAIAVNPDSALLPVTRSTGVLTAILFPSGGRIPGQVSAIRIDGWTIEETTLRPSLGISLNWPSMRTIVASWYDKSEEDQLKEVRRELDDLARAFDLALSYAQQRDADASTPIDLRWEAMRPLFDAKSGARVFVQANDAEQINAAVSFCAERGLRMVLVGGGDALRCADLLKRHDVPIILRGTQGIPRRDDEPINAPMSLAKRLHDAGLAFCVAHDDDTAHQRNLPYYAATTVAHGLPRDAALKSITLWAARIAGLGDTHGSLEVGKAATLFVCEGDPLEVTSNVVMAFIDGRPADLSNKHRQLADKYLERYRQRGDIPRP